MTTAAGAPRREATRVVPAVRALLPYLAAGTAFGIVLIKSDVVSWFRIQEMFRFHSFHMYGIIGSGFFTAFISLRVLRALGVRTLAGEAIAIPPKQMGSGARYAIGGFVFGLGWALTGTCPGPLFALIGTGSSVFLVVLVSALAGTWLYGGLRSRLPH